ncbi:MAG: hypothetical protein CL862_11530 [Cyanobium sp. NAT70]|nr:hypothetical protein [Cyanobium sp. NAT70]
MCTCTICGGSGIQRVSSQRFRTCLACLGTGQQAPAVQAAPLNHLTPNTVGLPRLSCVARPRS